MYLHTPPSLKIEPRGFRVIKFAHAQYKFYRYDSYCVVIVTDQLEIAEKS